jgi:SAM-dependent methyltransferase
LYIDFIPLFFNALIGVLNLQRCKEILDIGCGNGKNMRFPGLEFTGVDFCPELVDICRRKGLNAIGADMTSLPFHGECFDGVMAVASYHHLETDGDRRKALHEMHRVLKKGGKAMIVVWAREQEPGSRFVFESTIKTGQFGWDERVPWKRRDDPSILYRYYHVYGEGDLTGEIQTLCPEFCAESITWEKGNWIILVSKR